MNYQKHYNNLITRAQNRILSDDVYVEKHHIIPRCMGGTDDLINLAVLTPEEHYLAHLLLVKIFPSVLELVLAARYMCYGNELNGERKNNKMYGWLKRKFSETMSQLNTGRKQSPETIEKRANSNRGKKRTEKTKKKISESNKGKHNTTHTEETKKKISNTQKDQYSSGERIPGMKDKKHTDETKKKLSENSKGKRTTLKSRKGQKNTKAHNKKISESKKGKKREGFIPWNKGIPLSPDAKKTMGQKNSENLKGRTWEDIYGEEGAAKRRESQKLKRLKNKNLKDSK